MSNNQSKIGFDPLAWMKDDQGASEQKTSRAKPRSRDAASKSAPKASHPLGLDVILLEESFNLLAPQAEALVARFYDELFKRYPQVRPLFGNTTAETQQRKLLAALKLVVENLRNPQALAGALTALGERHQGYGAEPGHYQAVATTLLDVMAEFAGAAWTDEVAEAWHTALNVIAETMLSAYTSQTATRTPASLPASDSALLSDDHIRMRSSVDGATTAIMMIDRDFNINYANKSTVKLLTKHQETLRTIYPGFDAANLIGQNIDRFHKNPARQRQLLSDPANLPYATDIQVGPLKFRLNVTAIIDGGGTYIGNCLEWSDVTELRAREDDVARLQGAIDNAMTPIMMIDRTLTITYVNAATVKLMEKNLEILRGLYPGFDAHGLVGDNIDRFHRNPAHQRQLLNNPANLPYSTDIEVGPLKFHLNVTAVMNAAGEYIGNCLEWADVTLQRAKEKEVARLQSAIAGSTTSLMLCNENLDITYVNPAVVNLFRKRQQELRQVYPMLDADNLVGQNIDQFHKNAAHQRALLQDMNRLPTRSEIALLDLRFEVNATAIVDADGKYMGNMVEWKDITEQKDGERQIQGLIESAAAGDLDRRIDIERYTGFMKTLGEGINSLLNAVVTPVREGTRVVKALSIGDLTETMTGEFQGEFGVLRDAINQSITNLRQMVGEIGTSTGNIASAAAEIAQGNTDLSQRTEEQASSLEETASSMEELTSTVKQNADNARQANQLASNAREQAEKGGGVVRNAVDAMAEINDSSKKIADIIGVIDEIAFQTNLLALNAAVEAARAGEQGRGFAVVAGEVRNLAQRSAAAAKEIKNLIKDSVAKVEDGTRLVDASGKTLEEIVNAVKKVSDIIAEIAAASQEQSSGIEQINKAIVQMDEVTQQNAALVEQAAAASESLDEQAKTLERLMEFFSLEESDKEPVFSVNRGAKAPSPSHRNAPRQTMPQGASATRRAPRNSDTDDAQWEEF